MANPLNTTSNHVDADLPVYATFDEMGLPDDLLRGVYSHGFERPSPIQQRGIVPIKEGRHLLAQAQSGTGKTGTFLTGALTRVDPTQRHTQVLVLVPTRELATQISKVATAIGKHLPVTSYAAVGGTSPALDERALRNGQGQVLVGTPGRIYDMLKRGALNPAKVRVLVMDEADQMLEDRFREQVECILETGFDPAQTQLVFFSATMAPEVVEVAMGYVKDQAPARLLIPAEEVTLDGIKQFYVAVEDPVWKLETMCDLYEKLVITQGLIYCNMRKTAEWLAEEMTRRGFALQCIHGDLEHTERKSRMERFRSGGARVLISTDLLARGIDVQQVSLVINFEMPNDPANYIHRIGRSGRFGRKGAAINLVTPGEHEALKQIEAYYSTTVEELPADLKGVF